MAPGPACGVGGGCPPPRNGDDGAADVPDVPAAAGVSVMSWASFTRRFGRMESDVQHLVSDVSELKTDVKALHALREEDAKDLATLVERVQHIGACAEDHERRLRAAELKLATWDTLHRAGAWLTERPRRLWALVLVLLLACGVISIEQLRELLAILAGGG